VTGKIFGQSSSSSRVDVVVDVEELSLLPVDAVVDVDVDELSLLPVDCVVDVVELVVLSLVDVEVVLLFVLGSIVKNVGSPTTMDSTVATIENSSIALCRVCCIRVPAANTCSLVGDGLFVYTAMNSTSTVLCSCSLRDEERCCDEAPVSACPVSKRRSTT